MRLVPEVSGEHHDMDLFYQQVKLPPDVFYRGSDEGMVFIIPRRYLGEMRDSLLRSSDRLEDLWIKETD